MEWTKWGVDAVGANLVDVTGSKGGSERIALEDGAYISYGNVRARAEVGPGSRTPIIQASVHAPDSWRFLMQWAPRPGEEVSPLISISELAMAGDLFEWSNWEGPSLQGLRRVSVSISRVVR